MRCSDAAATTFVGIPTTPSPVGSPVREGFAGTNEAMSANVTSGSVTTV